MSNEDKLKSFLQQQFDGQEIPVPADAWQAAERHLAKRRGTRRFRGAVIFLLLTGFAALLLTSKNDETTTLLAEKPVVVEKHAEPGSLPEETTAGIGKKTAVTKPQTLNKQSKVAVQKPVQMIPAETVVDPVTPEAPATEFSEEQVPEVIEVSDESQQDAPAINEPDAPLPVAQANESPVAVSGNIEHPVSEIGIPVPSQPETIVHTMTVPDDSVSVTASDIAVSAEVVPDATQSPEAALTDQQIATDSLVRHFDNREGIYYEAGVTGLAGWTTGDQRDAYGLSPAVGINYLNRLSVRHAFSFGLSYMRVPRLSASSKTSKITAFGFGEESDVTVITPSAVHYVVAPLRLHYFQPSGHCFGGGVNVGYLLTVDAKVETYRQFGPVVSDYSASTLSGYTQGFGAFDLQASAFYRRRINKSLGIQAEVFIGLTDVKNNQFFTLEGFERNSGLKICLVYNAFRGGQR